MSNIPQHVDVNTAARLCEITRREVEFRMADIDDPKHLAWIDRKPVDGKRGRLIPVQALPFTAQLKLREEVLYQLVCRPAQQPTPQLAGAGSAANPTTLPGSNAGESHPSAKTAGSKPSTGGQTELFPRTEIDERIEALNLSSTKRDVVLRRLRGVELCINGKFGAEGLTRKADMLRIVAKRNNWSVRSLERYITKFKREGVAGLEDKDPGPSATGMGASLDDWQRSHLTLKWTEGLTARQAHDSLIAESKLRQESPKWRTAKTYFLPSYRTTLRFIESLGETTRALRNGPDALHAAAGYMDRSYLDLSVLERVENDECKLNIYGWDPRKPVDREGRAITPRYWVLTLYDARSIYPLVWEAVRGSEFDVRHGINEEDEINLFVDLVRTYGVPQGIHCDRGRFRGKRWGGAPLGTQGNDRDAKFQTSDGIFDAFDVNHNVPRTHNPRGTRLERFHRWVADWFRGKPGWIGGDTDERKGTRGDADKARHIDWLQGKLAPGEPSPLLTYEQIKAELNAMMEKWRDHNSWGTDMNGLTPRAVFVQNTPPEGFRRASEAEIALKTAQHFHDEMVASGGIIQLPDRSRYSSPLLTGVPSGECREVVRLRHDHSFIVVLPDQKGEEAIIARQRARVGGNNPQELARQAELQAAIKRLATMQQESRFGLGPETRPQIQPMAQIPSAQTAETAAVDLHPYVSPAPEPEPEPAVRFAAETMERQPEAIPSLIELEAFDPRMEEF